MVIIDRMGILQNVQKITFFFQLFGYFPDFPLGIFGNICAFRPLRYIPAAVVTIVSENMGILELSGIII